MRPTNAQRRVLIALVRVHQRQGRATMRDVANEAGLAGMQSVHGHLHALNRLGLVHLQQGSAGTLRPAACVTVIGDDLYLAARVR